jgi:hypothetical protein
MTQEGKDKIITRAIHFIATNTNDKSYRIGQAIIAELDLVKKLTLTHDVKSDSELLSCPNTSCPIIRYDNGESYCTKCHYTD